MRHERVVIEIRIVLGIFLEDGEDARRRLSAFLAARHWRTHDPAFVIVNRDLLVAQRDDRHDRLATRTRRYRLVVPSFCGVAKIARRYQGGQGGKCRCNAESRLFVLPDKGKRFHGTAIALNCFNHAAFHGPPSRPGPSCLPSDPQHEQSTRRRKVVTGTISVDPFDQRVDRNIFSNSPECARPNRVGPKANVRF